MIEPLKTGYIGNGGERKEDYEHKRYRIEMQHHWFCVLLYSSLMVTPLGDWAFSIHHAMFDITRHQFDIMVYGFIEHLKRCGLDCLLFLILPYDGGK